MNPDDQRHVSSYWSWKMGWLKFVPGLLNCRSLSFLYDSYAQCTGGCYLGGYTAWRGIYVSAEEFVKFHQSTKYTLPCENFATPTSNRHKNLIPLALGHHNEICWLKKIYKFHIFNKTKFSGVIIATTNPLNVRKLINHVYLDISIFLIFYLRDREGHFVLATKDHIRLFYNKTPVIAARPPLSSSTHYMACTHFFSKPYL